MPKSAFYGLPTDDREKTDVEVVTGKVEHRIDDVFTISDTARYGSYWFDARETNAHYGTANCYTTAPYAGAQLCATTANACACNADQSSVSGCGHATRSDFCPA